jgi:NAD(P)-dependent dehydrogenase (short-subunit alcohol dehydrogenase family)
LLTRTSSFG